VHASLQAMRQPHRLHQLDPRRGRLPMLRLSLQLHRISLLVLQHHSEWHQLHHSGRMRSHRSHQHFAFGLFHFPSTFVGAHQQQLWIFGDEQPDYDDIERDDLIFFDIEQRIGICIVFRIECIEIFFEFELEQHNFRVGNWNPSLDRCGQL